MGAKLAAIDWYDGHNGFVSPDSPALAICYTNGRCQIMKNESDDSNKDSPRRSTISFQKS